MSGRGFRIVLLALALGPAACRSPPASVEARRLADKIWDARCLNCHGRSGAGDGPQARLLDTKPRRLNDHAWQRSVTDEYIATVIVKGGQEVGMSPLMSPNPDLADKPEVVRALVARIRGL